MRLFQRLLALALALAQWLPVLSQRLTSWLLCLSQNFASASLDADDVELTPRLKNVEVLLHRLGDKKAGVQELLCAVRHIRTHAVNS